MATKQEWKDYFKLVNDREPTLEEYTQAVKNGEIDAEADKAPKVKKQKKPKKIKLFFLLGGLLALVLILFGSYAGIKLYENNQINQMVGIWEVDKMDTKTKFISNSAQTGLFYDSSYLWNTSGLGNVANKISSHQKETSPIVLINIGKDSNGYYVASLRYSADLKKYYLEPKGSVLYSKELDMNFLIHNGTLCATSAKMKSNFFGLMMTVVPQYTTNVTESIVTVNSSTIFGESFATNQKYQPMTVSTQKQFLGNWKELGSTDVSDSIPSKRLTLSEIADYCDQQLTISSQNSSENSLKITNQGNLWVQQVKSPEGAGKSLLTPAGQLFVDPNPQAGIDIMFVKNDKLYSLALMDSKINSDGTITVEKNGGSWGFIYIYKKD